MRVLFDLSALHGNRLELLRSAPTKEARRKRRIVFLHTPIFLNEILQGYGSSRAGNRWRENLSFACDLEPAGYFLDKEQIWRDELVCGRGRLARHFMPERKTRRWNGAANLRAEINRAIESGDLSQVWKAAETEIDEGHNKKRAQRKIAVAVREEIAEKMRDGSIRGRLKDASLAEILRRDTLFWGNALMDLVDTRHANSLRDQWAQNPARYPFYTSFVEGVAYFGFHAGILHQEGIDTNAQADYEQLCYLNWADVFVSDEQGFLRSAFNDLWKPRKKHLLTCQEFVDLVKRLA